MISFCKEREENQGERVKKEDRRKTFFFKKVCLSHSIPTNREPWYPAKKRPRKTVSLEEIEEERWWCTIFLQQGKREWTNEWEYESGTRAAGKLRCVRERKRGIQSASSWTSLIWATGWIGYIFKNFLTLFLLSQVMKDVPRAVLSPSLSSLERGEKISGPPVERLLHYSSNSWHQADQELGTLLIVHLVGVKRIERERARVGECPDACHQRLFALFRALRLVENREKHLFPRFPSFSVPFILVSLFSLMECMNCDCSARDWLQVTMTPPYPYFHWLDSFLMVHTIKPSYSYTYFKQRTNATSISPVQLVLSILFKKYLFSLQKSVIDAAVWTSGGLYRHTIRHEMWGQKHHHRDFCCRNPHALDLCGMLKSDDFAAFLCQKYYS